MTNLEKLSYGIYECGRIIRKEVTNETVKARFFEIRSELWELEDDEFDTLLEIIGNYVWHTSRSTAMILRHALKRYGIHATPKEAEMWYCLDEE